MLALMDEDTVPQNAADATAESADVLVEEELLIEELLIEEISIDGMCGVY
jgi:mycofactocin precursor